MLPFSYDNQIASIPAVVADVVQHVAVPALDATRPVIFTGIGTSLHAARVAADWVCQLSRGRVRAFAVDAHDLGTGVWPLTPQDQVVVISHRGKKIFPTASQRRALEAGAQLVVAIVGQAAPEQLAHVTVRTCGNETAATFSVSYLASLAVLAKLVAAMMPEESAAFLAALPLLAERLAETIERPPPMSMVKSLAEAQPILISGFAQDCVTAQEAALKIKEGAWLWTEGMSPEFALHGTPASYHSGMSALVILPTANDEGRTALLLDSLHRLQLACVATCGVDGSGADLVFTEPPNPLLRPFLAIIPFHLLTAELARCRDTDPDTLHGHREPWKAVMTQLRL